MDTQQRPSELIKRALKKAKVTSIKDLKVVFGKGLGTSTEELYILSSRDFSFADIKAIRTELEKY